MLNDLEKELIENETKRVIKLVRGSKNELSYTSLSQNLNNEFGMNCQSCSNYQLFVVRVFVNVLQSSN